MNRYLFSLLLFLFPFAVCTALPYADSLHAAGLADLAAAKAATHKDSSLQLLQEALGIFKKNDDLRAWINACKDTGVGFDMAGDLTTAMQVYNKATADNLFRRPARRSEWEALGWLYANAGYTLSWYGKYFDAKARYEKARQIFEDEAKFVDATIVAYVHRELGNIYTRFGDHEAALLMLQRVKEVALQHKNFNLASEACNDIGIAYHDTGKGAQAIEVCREALAFPGLNRMSIGLLESTLAVSFFQTGDRKEALSHALKSKAAFEFVIQNKLHPLGEMWLSLLKRLIGDLQKDPAAAESEYVSSLDLLKKCYPDTLRREFAKGRLALAGLYLREGRFADALRQQQVALSSILYRFRESDPLKNPSPSDFYPENTIMEALGGKAVSFRSLYDKTKKQQYLEKTLECHDLIFEAERAYRQVHHFESSKLAIVGESSQRAESAMEAAWRFYQDFQQKSALEQAFGFAEKSKSTLLFEALRHSGASSIANVPDSLLQKEKQLKDELTAAEKSFFLEKQKNNNCPTEKLEQQIFDYNAALSGLSRQIEEKYPAFFELKYRQNAISIAETQKLLRPKQALVEYFTGDSVIFIFLLKKDAFFVERVDKNFPLEQWVSQFREDIEAFQFPGKDREQLCHSYTELGQQLYQKLLHPLEKHGLPQELLIVPGGILGFLPFDALLYEAPPPACAFKKYPYLVRRHTISYNYSSTLFKELTKRKKQKAKAGFAGFAPEFDEGNSSGFGPLKFNIASVEAIVQLSGGASFLRTKATGQAFRENAVNHSILYLATHAKANTDEGDFSFIVLANEAGSFDTLFVKDIYNLPLTADLVFLGACETGSGKWYSGEGIISLARSFLYAGARSIVTTLWSINDESNKNLTVSFFSHLNDGMRKDEALRAAKLEQLENSGHDLYAHPVFWAAYTPIGNMEPVENGLPWWYWAVGIGLFTLIGIVVQQKYYS